MDRVPIREALQQQLLVLDLREAALHLLQLLHLTASRGAPPGGARLQRARGRMTACYVRREYSTH